MIQPTVYSNEMLSFDVRRRTEFFGRLVDKRLRRFYADPS